MIINHRINHATVGTQAGKSRTTAYVTLSVEGLPPAPWRLTVVSGSQVEGSYATADLWGNGWVPCLTFEAAEWHGTGAEPAAVIDSLMAAAARWMAGPDQGHLA